MMLTADTLARTLQKLGPRTASEPDVSDVRWQYRQAAAVLSYFDPHKLRPLGESEPGESAVTHLLLDTTPKEGDSQSGSWILRADVRRAALERLATVEALQSALAANHPRSDDVLQKTLDAAIMQRSLSLKALNKDELRSALLVADWLRGVVDGLPVKADIRRRLEWLDLLDPLQELAQLRWFCGRSQEKERLREFVERSATTSLYRRPPLFVHGPAGVGKSTLLASFLLEYLADDEGERPFFAYLDFNRPGLVDVEPLELMIEVARQLAVQSNEAPEEWSALRKRIKDQLAEIPGGGAAAERGNARNLMVRKKVLCDFTNAFVQMNRELLLVFDNFDEARLHGDEFTLALWNLLNEIQGLCPSLRCIQAGRDLPTMLPLTAFELGGLDSASSEELLEGLGVIDPEQARKVADQVDGNPQSLHLAARVLQRSRARVATFQGSKETVQASLYREYLTGIKDPELRRLAQYSFVLRHVTPVTVQQILAEPCGLEVFDRNHAERMVADLRREMLLARISENEPQHPAGIRRVMLRMLRRIDPERVDAIHQAAVRFYKKSHDFEARTEEMYHRLSSRELVTLGPLAQALRLALDDFPAEGQRHLADALEIRLPPDVRELADLEQWERKVEQQARREINRNRAKRALAYLRERTDRSVGSKLYLLEAIVQVQLNSLEAAHETIERGLASIAQIGDSTMHVDLLAERAKIEELEDAAERASADLEDAWLMAHRIDDPKRVLSLSLRRLRLHPLPESRSEDELKREVRSALLALSDTRLKHNPSDLWDSVAAVGEEYPEVIARAVRLLGSPSFSQDQLRRLLALVTPAGIRIEDGAAFASSMGAQVDATEHPTGADVSKVPGLILDLVKTNPRPDILKGIVELIEAARTDTKHPTGRPRSGGDPKVSNAGSGGKDMIDIVIITIREDEYRAVLDRVPDRRLIHGRNRTYSGGVINKAEGGQYTVAVLRALEQGPNAAQDATWDAIDDLDPRLIVVAGIGGAVPDTEFTLGDVVIASRLHDFTVAAFKEGVAPSFVNQGGPMNKDIQNLLALLPDLDSQLAGWNVEDQIRVPRPGVNLSPENFYGDENWQKDTRSSLQRFFQTAGHRTVPIFTTRAIASSGSLIKSTQILEIWRQASRDVAAVEMELSGIYVAARRRGKEYPILAIRGISDVVGLKRSPEWTAYACHTAAAFCIALLAHLPTQLLPPR